MKYKNTKTGAIVDSASIIKGKNWVEAEKEPNEVKDLKKLKKEQLIELLEEKEIDYTPEQTKDELIELLNKE